MADLKKVYTAVAEDEALENLMAFKEKWRRQYPSCVKSWEDNWDILSTFFAYPLQIGIDTTPSSARQKPPPPAPRGCIGPPGISWAAECNREYPKVFKELFISSTKGSLIG